MNQLPPQQSDGKPLPGPMRIKYFLLVFAIAFFFLGRILWPFWSILVLSFLLVNIFQPVYLFLSKQLPRSVASGLTCLMIIALVFFPLLFFTGALTGEALSFYNWVRDSQVWMRFQDFIQQSQFITRMQAPLKDFGIDFQPAQITASLAYFAKAGGLFLYDQASSWAANILQSVALFFIMILVIFFLFMDLLRLKEFLFKLSPLPEDENRLLVKKFEEIANAILKGSGICGIIQGIIGGVLFSIMHLPSPILWGCIMSVLAFLPIFGIGLVMLPAALALAIDGQTATASSLVISYLVLSLGMEYLIKPKLVGSQVEMHTLLVFLSIIGGISVYGILGIIYGPLIITAFLTLSNIYLRRYDQYVQIM
ncbi:AI-2E family transporter [Desulfotalea psychrophila]|uniref:Hypothetical membrane protein n=1 Tax=Desulfotalea psychrophila (strain LSv54 / DSM 12343) TaxID=177439 RepID=Q6ARV3_DESPS|nr:AI-2E family transporter [Desulfotalea psychrophila]CAG34922.1 hypothetical membrane protein [Desulfotalea psychrophila LSv54]